jgi:DNA polymerase I-like protein with 3'-5' exonuclease and polymerase domains
LARDEYLRSIFADAERDLFDELSNQLYGVGNWGKEERIRTKAFFYGLGYGRETASIAAEFKMPMREATLLRNNFMELIPATVNWQNKVRKQVLAGDDLVTPFGRRRRFHLITDQNKHSVLNEALSFLPQSTSSDVCLTALIELRPLLKGLGWIRLTIHDALVVECLKSKQQEVSDLLKRTMVDCGRRFTEYVPFAVDLSYGDDWGSL